MEFIKKLVSALFYNTSKVIYYHNLEGLYNTLKNNANVTATQFGYELLRDHLIPSVLGTHEDEILYWAGKEIARKFPLFQIEEIATFFNNAGWGTLVLDNSAKNEAFYLLMIESDTQKTSNRSYHLESGFIAEQYQKINGVLTECFVKPQRKGIQIEFQVKWDPKTTI